MSLETTAVECRKVELYILFLRRLINFCADQVRFKIPDVEELEQAQQQWFEIGIRLNSIYGPQTKKIWQWIIFVKYYVPLIGMQKCILLT